MASTYSRSSQWKVHFGKEATAGTPVAVTEKLVVDDFAPELDITPIHADGARGSVQKISLSSVQGTKAPSFTMDLAVRGQAAHNDLLEMIFGTAASTFGATSMYTYSNTAKSYTFAVYDGQKYRRYSGSKCNRAEFSADQNEVLKLHIEMFAMTYHETTATDWCVATSAEATPLRLVDGTFTSPAGGTAIQFESLSLEVVRNLRTVFANSQAVKVILDHGMVDTTFKVKKVMSDEVNQIITDYRAHTGKSARLLFSNGTDLLQFNLAKVFHKTKPAGISGALQNDFETEMDVRCTASTNAVRAFMKTY